MDDFLRDFFLMLFYIELQTHKVVFITEYLYLNAEKSIFSFGFAAYFPYKTSNISIRFLFTSFIFIFITAQFAAAETVCPVKSE